MASRQNAVGGGAPASAGPQVRKARPMRPAARGRYDDDDERPRRRRFEDEEDEKPRRRRADVSDDEDDYRPKKKPVKKASRYDDDEEEEERPTAAKPVNTHPLSKYVSLNVLTIVAGVMIMFVIVLSVLCRSGKKPARYGRDLFVMSRRVEEASLLNKASFASPAERPLTQASMSATEEATPIAVSIPAAPVEDNDDSIFDDGEGDTPIVKSHRRSHTKRVRHSKV